MQLSKAEFLASIEGLLPDNSTQEISPLDIRTSLINLADSVPNFLVGTTIDAANVTTPETRTTILGQGALNDFNRGLQGRSSSDNSAIGYATLRQNYDGSGNTAVGSFSQSCNLYGDYNTSVGFQSSASNITGSGNTSLGSFALNNNKRGSFNIAIGHGAGWYIGPERDFTLSIGSLPITSGDLCDANENLIYDGSSPLMFGNLKPNNHQLAIGTDYLHDYGMLQVSGDISPSISGEFSLGRSRFPWNNINEEIYFSGGVVGIGGIPSGAPQGITGNAGSPDARLTVYGDIVPSESGRFAIGHPRLTWDGYFNDVIVSGQFFANDVEYNTITECLYECKTLHLATSGFCNPEDDGFHDSAVCGILTDEQLDGAGLEVHSSGYNDSYRRDYRFIYKAPDASLTCLPADNAYTRSRWESNISLELVDNTALVSERMLSRHDAGVVIQSGCMGIFVEPYAASGQRVVIAQEPQYLDKYPTLDDVSFISRSGTDIIDGNPSGYDYTVMYGTVDSGVQVAQRFASRIKSSSTVRGFSIVYHDELDQE